jgi:hypothetical protein
LRNTKAHQAAGKTAVKTAVKVNRQCMHICLEKKVCLREGTALGSEDGKVIGSGML